MRRPPACLATEGPDAWTDETEAEDELAVLNRFQADLSGSGLVFPMRTIKAFHTSLKTSDISAVDRAGRYQRHRQEPTAPAATPTPWACIS